jgi:zinc transporter ZupT
VRRFTQRQEENDKPMRMSIITAVVIGLHNSPEDPPPLSPP